MFAAESPVLLIVACVVIALDVVVLLAARSAMVRLAEAIMAYRPGGVRRDRPGAEPSATDAWSELDDSPLREVFRRYSDLTDRMSELVFRLTDLRETGQASAAARAAQVREVLGASAVPLATPPEEDATPHYRSSRASRRAPRAGDDPTGEEPPAPAGEEPPAPARAAPTTPDEPPRPEAPKAPKEDLP